LAKPDRDNLGRLESRVLRAAEAALADHKYVTAVDVFQGIGWLIPQHVDLWRQGRVRCLENEVQASLGKLSTAMGIFGRWARQRGLRPSETDYRARTRDRRVLQFSVSGDPEIERAYRTHWVSPELSEAKRRRLADRQARAPDLVVVWALREWTCTSCSGTGEFLFMEDAGPLCLGCADLDGLVYLPSGDATLTRRAKKGSGLSAVVVRFSRARGRYERQGVLVEEEVLQLAEQACLEDEEARRRGRVRAEAARGEADVAFQAAFAEAIRRQFPGCPVQRAQAIASHAGTRGSGRVGRTAAGRALDDEAITLAVAASVRHTDTSYDELLMSGVPRTEARERVRDEVREILDVWRSQVPGEAPASGTDGGGKSGEEGLPYRSSRATAPASLKRVPQP
jgi:hypothetical protein